MRLSFFAAQVLANCIFSLQQVFKGSTKRRRRSRKETAQGELLSFQTARKQRLKASTQRQNPLQVIFLTDSALIQAPPCVGRREATFWLEGFWSRGYFSRYLQGNVL